MVRPRPPELDEVVRRLVETLAPERIILFGSRARGDADPASDWDLAVIADSDLPWYERERLAYHRLWGVHLPVELVVLTPSEVEAQRDVPGSLAWVLERDGAEVWVVGGASPSGSAAVRQGHEKVVGEQRRC